MKVVLAGGGTGGHVYPAVTIAKAIVARDPKAGVLFVGTPKGLETDVVPREGFALVHIGVMGFERRLSFKTLTAAFKAGVAVWKSYRILRDFRPDVVVGTGGYVSGPVALAARILRIPLLIHEQNAVPGVTNRVLSLIAGKVAVTYPESRRHFPNRRKVVVTGNPVRPAILATSRDEGAWRLGLDPKRPLLLVFGGSQGSRAINKAMIEAMELLQGFPGLQVLHQTGKAGYDEVLEALSKPGIGSEGGGNIKVVPYLYNMEDALACADLVVARSGAISIAEITARGLPALLIPFPASAENHQERNAMALERAGAAVVILEKNLTGKRLAGEVWGLLSDPKRLVEMASNSKKLGKPEATDTIVDCVWALANHRA